MSSITTYMSLTAWTSVSDPYSHTQLATNWQLVDAHDHTAGKGKQIPTGGLQDRSVTSQKLAEPAVNTTNYVDNSITIEKLAPGLLDALYPMGLISPFWRPSGSSGVIYGNGRASGKLFELCDGHTILAADHDLGGGDIVLPNLIDKFIFFGLIGNIGETGGTNSRSLAHSHTVASHTHAVGGHTHPVNGTVSGGEHTHSFTANLLNGDNHLEFMRHLTRERFTVRTYQIREPATSVANSIRPGILAVEEFISTERGTETVVPEVPPITGTTDQSGHSHSVALTSGASGSFASGSASPGTDSALGTVDMRPAFMTLVPVVRVRRTA